MTVMGPFKSYCYYKWDSGFTSSTTMGANTAANMHLPFNPILGEFNPPKVEYGEEEITFFSDQDTSVAYSTQAEPEETENEAMYRSPLFLLNSVFDHKTVTATWLVAGSNNTLTGDFTSQSHITTLFVQNHVHEQLAGTANLDHGYYGVKVTEYWWEVQKGKRMKEGWKWKARNYSANTQACDMDAGFDDSKFDRTGIDGGFDNWDGSCVNGLHSTDLTLTAGGAAISHVNVENYKMGMKRPVEFIYNSTSRDAFDYYNQPRKYYLEVEGTISGANQYTAIKTTLESRTPRTYKITYQTNKYLQFTQGVLKRIEGPRIPKAGEVMKVKLLYEGIPGTSGSLPTMSFSWTGPETTDPSNAIFHT